MRKRGDRDDGNKNSMNCVGKRAATSAVDWMMSLGIFMIYLAWFFIYVRPLTSPPVEMGSLLKISGDAFKANVTWGVDVVPLVIFSNITGSDEPVIADFAYIWNSTSFSFADNRSFFLDEHRLFFLNNMTAGRRAFELVHSSEAYSQPTSPQRDIAATKDSVSVGKASMRADFSDSVLVNAIYRDYYRIQGFNITINSVPIAVENRTFTITPIIAKYKIQSQMVNHSSYVFAGNPRIYSFVSLNKPLEQQQNFSISMTIFNSTQYYSDKSSGDISFNNTCKDLLANYIDLSDGIAGFAFIFADEANISMCAANNTLRIKANFILKNETRYDIIMHPGNYNSTIKYISPYASRFGAIDVQKGFSSRLLSALNSTNYSVLKTSWKYPPSREMAFIVVNESNEEIYRYEPSTPGRNSNVFVREISGYMLDQYSKRQKVTARIKGW